MISVCTFPHGGKYQRPPGAGEFPCLPHRPRTPVFLSMSSCGSHARACEGVHDRAAHKMVRLPHRGRCHLSFHSPSAAAGQPAYQHERRLCVCRPSLGIKSSDGYARRLQAIAVASRALPDLPRPLRKQRFKGTLSNLRRQSYSAATSASTKKEGVRGKTHFSFPPAALATFDARKWLPTNAYTLILIARITQIPVSHCKQILFPIQKYKQKTFLPPPTVL